ncbi:MAG TPA: hypothetical protein VEZ51_01005, partial [Gemmatimonadaceae bacterium]|nr:hypothetical protein [Gemmatimonadaceae bacterium]
MNHTSRVSLLLGLLFAAVSAAARAQSAPSSAPAAAQSAPTEMPEAWSAKPVGGYRLVLFNANPDGPMQVDLTISEVDGKLSANFWPVGDNDGH